MAHKLTIRGMAKHWLLLVALIAGAGAVPAGAATCLGSGGQGTASNAFNNLCWFDFTTYDDTIARSPSGQTISYSPFDGSTITFTIKVTGSALAAATSPPSGATAIGNSAFMGIAGKPLLVASGGTATLTFSGMTYTPASGSGSTGFQFTAADGETTNDGESLSFTTNGGNWTTLEQVKPVSGSLYPTISNTGPVFTETGVTGTVGSYVMGSVTPTTIITTIDATAGTQAVMFGTRFSKVRFTNYVSYVRADASDQFTASIRYASSGNQISYSTTTTGNSLAGFTIFSTYVASFAPINFREVMAAGSTNSLSAYRTTITCTNQISSSTPRPNNTVSQSYNFATLQPGDTITCNMFNAPFPRLRLTKALGAPGRAIAEDQFTLNVTSGGSTVATTTTTGTGTTVTNDTTPWYQGTTNASGVASTVYGLSETPSGSTVLGFYTSTMACTNANGSSSTTLPTTVGGTITPLLGDVVTCTITNTAKPATVTLLVTKTMAVVSDPVNGTTNPKLIPGAVVRYTTTVTNTGQASVDASTLVITDPLPLNMTPSVANPAVTFADGTVPSGLAFDPVTDVSYSSAIDGGAPFTAAPAPDANGYDANIRGLRIAPTGTMAGRTVAGQPSFTVSFLAQVN